MFTDARPRVAGTRISRPAMRELIQLLQSFEPADRARAGHELVTGGLSRTADPLLEHVANEFDDRVLAYIARAVGSVPAEAKESRRVKDLRAWADSELERLALEEAFLGREPEPVAVPDPATHELRNDLQAVVAPAPAPTRHISWRPPGVTPAVPGRMPSTTETAEEA